VSRPRNCHRRLTDAIRIPSPVRPVCRGPGQRGPGVVQFGEDVIFAGSVSNDDARRIFGDWKEPRPYIRIVPQPS
jgi:hypothetical protein